MAVDQTLVGQAAAEVMDRIEANFGDQGHIAQDGQLASVALIVAVQYNGGSQTFYDFSFSPPAAPHEAIGLLQVVLNAITTSPPPERPPSEDA